ncbi:MAG: hypothetical protein DRO90_01655 [Candidatus Altiarchaeales archaeon]|nr:MAG: hypothetical protein DRO95_01050 [Candidatus Altiarchaeales archaeon]RLI93497.1 MAG: hypothetical protein DRO94_05060 [Candidatus Altiarchaeales archaeon]RLI94665.1 MAG: hypothetical protein DRO90_01655 [Candidatus Altiarchaeales archaeon]HDO82208.1 hypothetical protein [Candidatus Altiarchaeales archaeon]HEX54857.1 hypothetical protein [Candidatus Altiarchaeales archaeon]
MKAVILAAGEGKRLKDLTRNKPKALVEVLGVPLIERAILTAKLAGIREFLIIVGYLGDKIKDNLGDGSKFGVKIDYIENKEWRKGNATSLLRAREFLKERFILLMSDHIFDERILKAIINFKSKSSVVLAVDRRESIRDDTKVLEKNGRIISIGKDIEEYNCIDTGIFSCAPKIFSYAENSIRNGRYELSDCIMEAARNADARIFDITGIDRYEPKMRKEIQPWWIDIDTVEDIKRAEDIIIENASKNPSDLLACYVHKPIENKIVSWIAKNFKITPNQITIVVNILAYIITALFLFGYLLPASILTFVVGILDGLDGKLARVKLRTSRIGLLEHSFDLLFEFSWIIALALFIYFSTKDSLPLILGMLILMFIAFYRSIYDQFRKATGISLDDSGDFERRFRRIAGRRNLYNIPIFISILLSVPLYSLIFILIHSGITAVVYSTCAIRHLSEKKWQE